ncbi:MAG: hypothetical protein RLY31_60 [Bacteroidota bacterium]
MFVLTICYACQGQPEPAVAALPNMNPTAEKLKYRSGIRSIFQDSRGNYWFGSHQEGVCRFDGESFTYFTEADGLSDNQVRSIFEDANGTIWFECGEGVSYHDGLSVRVQQEKDYDAPDDWRSAKGDLWFKGDESIDYHAREAGPGVYRFDGEKFTWLLFPALSVDWGRQYYSVSTPFVAGADGTVWFGTYGAAIGYDGTDFRVVDRRRLAAAGIPGELHIRSLFEDSAGNLWLGNNGIGVLLLRNDSLVHFSRKMNLVSPLSRLDGSRSPAGTLEHVFAIAEDKQGHLWFGDRDTGAWRYDGKTMRHLPVDPALKTPHVWCIYQDMDDNLLLGMADKGVYRFDGEGFEQVF